MMYSVLQWIRQGTNLKIDKTTEQEREFLFCVLSYLKCRTFPYQSIIRLTMTCVRTRMRVVGIRMKVHNNIIYLKIHCA